MAAHWKHAALEVFFEMPEILSLHPVWQRARTSLHLPIQPDFLECLVSRRRGRQVGVAVVVLRYLRDVEMEIRDVQPGAVALTRAKRLLEFSDVEGRQCHSEHRPDAGDLPQR